MFNHGFTHQISWKMITTCLINIPFIFLSPIVNRAKWLHLVYSKWKIGFVISWKSAWIANLDAVWFYLTINVHKSRTLKIPSETIVIMWKYDRLYCHSLLDTRIGFTPFILTNYAHINHVKLTINDRHWILQWF